MGGAGAGGLSVGDCCRVGVEASKGGVSHEHWDAGIVFSGRGHLGLGAEWGEGLAGELVATGDRVGWHCAGVYHAGVSPVRPRGVVPGPGALTCCRALQGGARPLGWGAPVKIAMTAMPLTASPSLPLMLLTLTLHRHRRPTVDAIRSDALTSHLSSNR